ncbi:hypothetical protein [Blastococcus litoris]|uniref:hypothetical protein n=1 Tax=Blastococcus litoris TaxID=2171622 RepID=UPI000E2FFEEC|nr:hypothetical protein [Blastococcus litoris]
MAGDRPDPGEFLDMAQRMLRELFGEGRRSEEPWSDATRRFRESFAGDRPARSEARYREPSPEEQRENLTFALATRAVEALEDVALNVAAIRQRLERTAPPDRPAAEDDGQGGAKDG